MNSKRSMRIAAVTDDHQELQLRREPDADPIGGTLALAPVSGYACIQYARALSTGLQIVELPRSRGYLLVRPIVDSDWRDATGCYPVFSCPHWIGLGADLEDVANASLVAVSLVADPLEGQSADELLRTFDHVHAFKQHYIVDLARLDPSRHHATEALRARRQLDLVALSEPATYEDQWVTLYGELVARKQIRGPAAFDEQSLRAQLRVPGLRAFGAYRGGRLCSVQLWFLHDTRAYYHLSASNDEGRRTSSAYALMDFGLRELARGGMCRANLGGGPGTAVASSGLEYFKRGWANSELPAFVCGKILNPERYNALSRTQPSNGSYFPAYRRPDGDSDRTLSE